MGRYFPLQVMIVLSGIGMRIWDAVVLSGDGCLAPSTLEYLFVGSEQRRTGRHKGK